MPFTILIPAGNPSQWTGPTGNNTYLLPGRVPTLIDAGVGNPTHLDAVTDGLEGRALTLVLITHGHVDHVAGMPQLRERWPDVVVRQMGAGDVPLQPDEAVAAGDGVLRVVATPGHAPDHCSFFDEGSRECFCGDLARAGGTVVIPARRGGDLAAYIESLQRVRALAPIRLLPGHGPIVDDPLALIDGYLRHRAERDRQILERLQAGAHTAERLAEAMYQGLAQPFQAAAIETVLAHLIKLQQEGKVGSRGELWFQAG